MPETRNRSASLSQWAVFLTFLAILVTFAGLFLAVPTVLALIGYGLGLLGGLILWFGKKDKLGMVFAVIWTVFILWGVARLIL